MLHFIDTEIPATMAPMDAVKDMRLLELGIGTWESCLAARWDKFDSLTTVSARFWPSAALLEQLAQEHDGFLLTDNDGKLLAETGTSKNAVLADKESLLIRYPWDLLKVHEEILSGIRQSSLSGTVRDGAVIDGTVILDEGAVLLPGVFIEGTAVIGKNCRLGPNCYLRGCTFIGDNCHIGQAVEIKNSIVMHHTAVAHLSYFGDSIICPETNIGGGTIASNFRHDGKNHRSMVAGELVETGRRKFGTVIGPGVHTGIHTSIYPGRKLYSGTSTLPGEIVKKDLK